MAGWQSCCIWRQRPRQNTCRPWPTPRRKICSKPVLEAEAWVCLPSPGSCKSSFCLLNRKCFTHRQVPALQAVALRLATLFSMVRLANAFQWTVSGGFAPDGPTRP